MKELVVVAPSGLILRTGPAKTFTELRTVPHSARVTRLGAVDDGSWIYASHTDAKARLAHGWLSAEWLRPAPVIMPEPFWLQIARGEIGQAEIPGAKHNPRILEYHAATTLRATTDEVPWCSSFACWVMEQAGVRSTRSAAARSWLTWGREIRDPEPGCLVVFTRGAPPAGHVAFYVDRQGEYLRVLGGNQSGKVCESRYLAADVLGYRMPTA